jgi:magnesium-transporting ATPase (P-type)
LFYRVKKLDFYNETFEEGVFLFLCVASERPSSMKNPAGGRRHLISNRLPDELIITIACIIGILLFIFLFFLIYHFRNQKSLRQTLLATRILATRGISNLKSVSLFVCVCFFFSWIDQFRINFIEVILIQKLKDH